ncbi:uncharacterized protein DS421_15g510720 [Arachis hypogaea]|nr:uncharacterized protein DS421_15g510720 [Arachis hypogaea]
MGSEGRETPSSLSPEPRGASPPKTCRRSCPVVVLPSITSFRHLKRIATTRGRARAQRERKKEGRSREEEREPPRGAAPLCAIAIASECCRRRASRREKEVAGKMRRYGGSATALLLLGRRRPEWVSRRGFCHRWSSVAVVVMATAPLAAGSSIMAARTSLSWLSPGICASELKLLLGHRSFWPLTDLLSGQFEVVATSLVSIVSLSSGDFVLHKCCGGCRVIPFISEVVAELICGAEAVSYIEKNTQSWDFDCDFEMR